MPDAYDVFKALTLAEADFRSGLAKITEVRAYLASMNLATTTKPTCPVCGIELPGPRKLAEHLYVIHDGPVPAHWDEAEAKAEL